MTHRQAPRLGRRGSPPRDFIYHNAIYAVGNNAKTATIGSVRHPASRTAAASPKRRGAAPGHTLHTIPATLALVVAQVIEPAAKLATARGLREATATHSLRAVLGSGAVAESCPLQLPLLDDRDMAEIASPDNLEQHLDGLHGPLTSPCARPRGAAGLETSGSGSPVPAPASGQFRSAWPPPSAHRHRPAPQAASSFRLGPEPRASWCAGLRIGHPTARHQASQSVTRSHEK